MPDRGRAPKWRPDPILNESWTLPGLGPQATWAGTPSLPFTHHVIFNKLPSIFCASVSSSVEWERQQNPLPRAVVKIQCGNLCTVHGTVCGRG